MLRRGRPAKAVIGLIVLGLAAGCGEPSGGPQRPQFVPSTASPQPAVKASANPTAVPSQSLSKSPTPRPTKVSYVFPVKSSNVDWHDTHAAYPATDIFADCGEPVVAATDGVILEISLSDRFVKGTPDGPYNGGLFVSLEGDDGVRYYGSHMSKVKSGIKPGVRVKGGDRLGDIGHTGNANNVCHLHFAISPPCQKVGDWDIRRGVVWPYSFLDSWHEGGNKSPVATVASWQKQHNCKA